MGVSISWLGFSGKSRPEVLATLHLVDSGVATEPTESDMSIAEFPDGWTIVYLNKFDHPFAEDASLRLFSQGCRVLAGHIEEHVMFSSVELYADGTMVWSAFHDGQQGIFSIETEGTPPETYEQLREELTAKQKDDGGADAEVDHVFELPVMLAEQLCGYRYDHWTYSWGLPRFTTLRDRSAMQ